MMEAWAVYYYFSTVRIPRGGADSVLFIRALLIGISVCFPFVIWSAIQIFPRSGAAQESEKRSSAKDRGFLDHRRLFFTGALAAYAVALTLFGYLIPSAVFIFAVCYYLGVRSFWILIFLPVSLSSFLAFFFKHILAVPIPVWPSW